MKHTYWCKKCRSWHEEGTQEYQEHMRYGVIPRDADGLVVGIGDYVVITKGVWEGEKAKVLATPSKTGVTIAFPSFGHIEIFVISSSAVKLSSISEARKDEIDNLLTKR